jgi:hypothetical protein
MKNSPLALSLALAVTLCSSAFADKRKDSGPGPNLDTGAPAPTAQSLSGYSYTTPYLPQDLVHERKSPESGPCTWEGIVVQGAVSRRTCQIYRSGSDGGVYKVMYQRNEHDPMVYIPRIFRRNGHAPNAWIVWVEFDKGQVTAVSPDAQRFVAAHGRGTDQTKHPALADRYPPRPGSADQGTPAQQTGSGTPETPADLGSMFREGILKKIK